jgi:biopolymer transport protein ExbD
VRIARGDEGDEFALNLTSMTDIVFLMLVFFMLATTFVDPERALGVELPGAASSAETPADELVINVLEDGSFVVGGETLTREALQAHLERTARAAPETPVTIRGHRLAHHEAIVTVMDACGLAGLTNLSVGTSERDSRG